MTTCFGHTGSTGIVAFAVKERNIIYVITTNRMHPDVNNFKIYPYVPKFADAIIDALSK